MTRSESLIEKYNVPVPRYTSYPTVPHWDRSGFSLSTWRSKVFEAYQSKGATEGISVYIHLPYCESLCTYCGCTTRITINHAVEKPYLDHVLMEWEAYVQLIGTTPKLQEIHLGGGTPTFFSAAHLQELIQGILDKASCTETFEISFEGHPANTSYAHLETLYQLGARRVSFGIQDFDPKVQDTIHRFQTKEQVRQVTEWARAIGYTSVNFDLVYGLPFQSIDSIQDTFSIIRELRPDRIAYYSYAHVPWLKPGQRKFTELDLPDNAYKRALYETGKSILVEVGYHDIGMDHFSLPEDNLYLAWCKGQLHRNFMGYTTTTNSMLIGLGCSSISDVGTAYAQNPKVVERYFEQVEALGIAANSGHICSSEDQRIRVLITSLITQGEVCIPNELLESQGIQGALEIWKEMETEGLVFWQGEVLKIKQEGKSFVRNICSALDTYYEQENQQPMFSKSI
ncbi:MAG: oxygen-independent coproporphyrinogen III oxidase [Cytophagaceae bacterium]|nr:oxygen-independent coproporphyrinogen III oxidase [Cytophagaceae bacterium]